MDRPHNRAVELLNLEPALVSRIKAELSAQFDLSKPIRVSRAPGRLDVMGGIADYTGSLVCEATLDCAAAVAVQERSDRQIQIFSFNLYDEHQPFTFQMPLAALARHSVETLHREFNQPGRKWAGYIAGCLFVLHEERFIDLDAPDVQGLNIALYSTVPLGAGVSSSAAIEVATMINLADHFGLRDSSNFNRKSQIANRKFFDAMRLAELCQRVENRIVGAPCGIMDQVACCSGEAGRLLRMVCQPHELQPPLDLPEGIRVLGMNSGVKHNVGGGQYGRTRCAAFMGHSMILEKMRQMGAAAEKTLETDPMNGYLANLDPEDYKKFFRPFLPEWMNGLEFLEKYGPTLDPVTVVHPDHDYPVQHAVDHHVLEARRVKNFAEFLEEAAKHPPGSREKLDLLNKAGHLMYASHLSYTNDAMLGAPECDWIVQSVRQRESEGLYGAKITGGGSGGTVAILADIGEKTDEAIDRIMSEYEARAGRKPQAFRGTSPGAWAAGTGLIS